MFLDKFIFRYILSNIRSKICKKLQKLWNGLVDVPCKMSDPPDSPIRPKFGKTAKRHKR